MFRKVLLCAVTLAAFGAVGAADVEAVDRFALVRIVNTSDLNLGFDYQFGNGPWQSVRLAPGEWKGLYAGFTAPGSYVHDPIRIRFDEDLRPGRDHWRVFLPYVRYSPDVDWSRAQVYYFDYDGTQRQFVAMFRAG